MVDNKNDVVPEVEEIIDSVESTTVTIHDDQWSLLLDLNDSQNDLSQLTYDEISILNDNITSLNDVVSSSSATTITYEQAETIIGLMNSGLEMFGLVVGGVFIWFVLKTLYRLFGGVLFGGL